MKIDLTTTQANLYDLLVAQNTLVNIEELKKERQYMLYIQNPDLSGTTIEFDFVEDTNAAYKPRILSEGEAIQNLNLRDLKSIYFKAGASVEMILIAL